MSLLDGLLRDALLETVIQNQVVFFANRTDASSTPGAGTELNPYEAMGTLTDVDPPFDKLMRTLASQNQTKTVKLLPGVYHTNGFNPAQGQNTGWSPSNGMRIVGSGTENTTLKLTNNGDVGQLTAAVGNNPAGSLLDGFELSDLTIDANFSGAATGTSKGGILLTGKRIYIHRVRIFNFGTKTSGPDCIAASVARAQGTNTPEFCVLEQCIIENPGTGAVGSITGILLNSQTDNTFHKFCVVRSCYINLGSATTHNAISAGGGIGTILEFNRILNAGTAVKLAADSVTTKDLLVRHNYMDNVSYGFEGAAPSTKEIQRLIILNNVVEWKAAAAGAVTGVKLSGSGTFKTVIIRDNVMRRRENEAGNNSEKGIDLESATYDQAIVDNNVMDIGSIDDGLRHPNTGKIRVFNNQKKDGTLVRGFNTGTGTHDQELTTEVEDVLLGI